VVGSSVYSEPRTFTASTRYGFRLHGNTRDYIDRYVYYFGVWEPHLSTFITRRLRPGDVFVDVGANIGYYSLLASRLVGGSGSVVAVEASPAIFKALQRNLSLNDARNVRPVNVAISDCDGDVPLYDGPKSQTCTTSVIEQDGLTHVGTVRALRLGNVLSDDELSRARLFKIDVEGAEYLAVRGFAEDLARTRRDAEFVIEISPKRLQLQGRTAEDILEIFRSHGFHAYHIPNDYHISGYIDRQPYEAPRRLSHEILHDSDVVFSRSDGVSL
jgi:FkbM family methyltransferase